MLLLLLLIVALAFSDKHFPKRLFRCLFFSFSGSCRPQGWGVAIGPRGGGGGVLLGNRLMGICCIVMDGLTKLCLENQNWSHTFGFRCEKILASIDFG